MANNKKQPNILIIGTLPFFNDAPSRQFNSYISGIEKKHLRQIFSSNVEPVKCHCESLFRITDKDLIKRRFSKKEVGTIFNDSELKSESGNHTLNDGRVFSFFKKDTALKHLIRKIIWKKKYWATNKLIRWVEEFKPNVILMMWSNDFFVFDICDFFSRLYKIPIIASVSDDYFFIKKKTFSPFYSLYKHKIKKRMRSFIISKNNHLFFVDDKMRDFYNSYFGISGSVIHIGTSLSFQVLPIKRTIRDIYYFGSLGFSRDKTIAELGKIIDENNYKQIVHVFSPDYSKKTKKVFKGIKCIVFNKSIPYKDVRRLISQSDMLLVVEALNNKVDIQNVRFSLSTKVADSLASGKPVLAIGSLETGMMNYMTRNNCAICSTTLEELKKTMVDIDKEQIDYDSLLDNAKKCVAKDFSEEKNSELFINLIDSILKI